MSVVRHLAIVSCVMLAAPAVAQADTMLTGAHFMTGGFCAGPQCADGDASPTLGLMAKSDNTPGLAMRQFGGGFGAYAWDIGGNEANFFLRNNTDGGRLVFRVKPGALSNQLQLNSFGVSNFAGVATEEQSRDAVAAVATSRDFLTPLRTLPFQTYRLAGDSTQHIAPTYTAFNTAFGVGAGAAVSFSDLASVSLLATRQLDARVAEIERMATGPAGPAGPAGPVGPMGPAGVPGAGVAITGYVTAKQLAFANARIATLQRENQNQSVKLARLERQVNAVVRAAK